MADALWASVVFVMLCVAAALGHGLVGRLPAVHRSPATLDFTRLVTSMLLTFSALVLGLLIASVNASFERTGDDLQRFAANMIRLAVALEEYGPSTQPIRAELRSYVASAVASTWPEEPAPAGRYPKAVVTEDDFDSTTLGALLHEVSRQIMALEEADPTRKALKAACLARIDAVEAERWTLIGEAHHSISPPFFDVTLFWLVVIFLSFGLNAPPNALAKTSIGLVALCVSGAFFVLLELDGPLDGVVKVSSEPMRHALRHLDLSLAGPPDPAPR